MCKQLGTETVWSSVDSKHLHSSVSREHLCGTACLNFTPLLSSSKPSSVPTPFSASKVYRVEMASKPKRREGYRASSQKQAVNRQHAAAPANLAGGQNRLTFLENPRVFSAVPIWSRIIQVK